MGCSTIAIEIMDFITADLRAVILKGGAAVISWVVDALNGIRRDALRVQS